MFAIFKVFSQKKDMVKKSLMNLKKLEIKIKILDVNLARKTAF